MFLIAAQSVADHVSDDDIAKGSLYPPLGSVQQVSFDIAVGLTKYAYAKGKSLSFIKFCFNTPMVYGSCENIILLHL